MKIDGLTRVGDVVRENFRAAQVFEKNKIDFCCGGGISIEDACAKWQVDKNQLLADLEMVVGTNDPESKYINTMSLDALCDYIEKRHHSYVVENIPFLKQKLEKLENAHGANHPELAEIKSLFYGAAKNLSDHLQKEEQILFPYIRQMVKAKSQGKELDGINRLESLLGEFDEEHQTEGDRFAKITELTNGYVCPPDGCNTYRVTYQTMEEFEKDLHRHIHLENNILFVKALALEKELIK